MNPLTKFNTINIFMLHFIKLFKKKKFKFLNEKIKMLLVVFVELSNLSLPLQYTIFVFFLLLFINYKKNMFKDKINFNYYS